MVVLGRKAMTNLDSILKSRDITLLTKAHLVKAMVFPEVIYGYESWTIKKVGERMGREVGGGIGMGNTCKPMAVSFQCMTKSTTNKN